LNQALIVHRGASFRFTGSNPGETKRAPARLIVIRVTEKKNADRKRVRLCLFVCQQTCYQASAAVVGLSRSLSAARALSSN
jgi:hypothetical protein